MSGFTAVGMDVFLLGPMPTPAVAMLTRSLRADLGVMISASHNPYEDNGIKLFGPDGFKLSDETESEIEARYRQAYAFAAAFSTGVMMPMGFEYGWARRISVVPQDDETAESPRFDLGVFIAAVNRLKQAVPALNEEGPQRLLSRPSDPLIVLLRQSESGAERAFTLVNTQEHEPREVAVAELSVSVDILVCCLSAFFLTSNSLLLSRLFLALFVRTAEVGTGERVVFLLLVPFRRTW
jgi:hypothetical protein